MLLDKLKSHIQNVLAHSTMCRYGRYTRMMAEHLWENDTVINFNYDLLLDQELIEHHSFQYENFSELILGEPLFPELSNEFTANGLYLKLRGSVNRRWCFSAHRSSDHANGLQGLSNSPRILNLGLARPVPPSPQATLQAPL